MKTENSESSYSLTMVITIDEELEKTHIIFTLENQRRRYFTLKSKAVNAWDKENSF